jgi:cell division septation protein DedD
MSKAKEKSGTGQKKIVLSRGHAILLSGFFLFLLFWVFVLGVFVGKGVIPGAMFDIKEPINRVRALLGLNEKIKYDPPKEDNLDFYKELENKKKNAKIDNLLTQEDKTPDQKITLSRDSESPPQDKNEVRGVIKPRDTDEEVTPPVQGEDIQDPFTDEPQEQVNQPSSLEDNPPRPEPEQAVEESYSVQLAAITDLEMAEKMVKELVDRGYDAYYYAATISGKKKYRIMCGKFRDRNDAIKYHSRLKKLSITMQTAGSPS